jgi:hypothetical protein
MIYYQLRQPGKCLWRSIITFDDGDHSWFTLVKPLLLKYSGNNIFLWTYMIGHDSFIAGMKWKK